MAPATFEREVLAKLDRLHKDVAGLAERLAALTATAEQRAAGDERRFGELERRVTAVEASLVRLQESHHTGAYKRVERQEGRSYAWIVFVVGLIATSALTVVGTLLLQR